MYVPKQTEKYVEWDDEVGQGRIIILCGYCPDSIKYFLAFFELAKSIDQTVCPEETICSKVQKSDRRQGFTMLLAQIKGPRRDLGIPESSLHQLGIQAF